MIRSLISRTRCVYTYMYSHTLLITAQFLPFPLRTHKITYMCLGMWFCTRVIEVDNNFVNGHENNWGKNFFRLFLILFHHFSPTYSILSSCSSSLSRMLYVKNGNSNVEMVIFMISFTYHAACLNNVRLRVVLRLRLAIRKRGENTRQGAYNQWEMLWYDFEMSEDFYPRSLYLSRFQQIVQGNKQKCTPKTREFPQKISFAFLKTIIMAFREGWSSKKRMNPSKWQINS